MSRLPDHYQWFLDRFPQVAAGYEGLGTSGHQQSSLDAKTRALLKVAISGAARLEGGLHAHVRKALHAGASADEIYEALLLLMPTVGFPAAMAALAWARDVLEKKNHAPPNRVAMP